MKRYVSLWAVLAVVLAASVTPAHAQPASDEWQVFVAPYLMGAAMSGATTVRGGASMSTCRPPTSSRTCSSARWDWWSPARASWGVGADLIWMALGTTVRDTNVDFNQGAFAFYGLRELGPAADVTFGARINTLQGTLTFKGPGIEVSQDKTWVDPIAGLTLRTAAGRPVQLRVYTEIGGFGLGSDFTWQVFPTVGIRLGRSASLELGYRWLDLDYATGEGTGEFGYDVLTQGPSSASGSGSEGDRNQGRASVTRHTTLILLAALGLAASACRGAAPSAADAAEPPPPRDRAGTRARLASDRPACGRTGAADERPAGPGHRVRARGRGGVRRGAGAEPAAAAHQPAARRDAASQSPGRRCRGRRASTGRSGTTGKTFSALDKEQNVWAGGAVPPTVDEALDWVFDQTGTVSRSRISSTPTATRD